MKNAIYIVVLLAFISAVMVSTYVDSETRTIVVTDKYIENVRGRWGRNAERFVLRTAEGDLPILKFPLIGYTLGADEVYASITPGDAIDVRVGQWPPSFLGDRGRPNIMSIQ